MVRDEDDYSAAVGPGQPASAGTRRVWSGSRGCWTTERRTYSLVWRVRWKGAHACDKGLHSLPRVSGGGANTVVVRKAWRNDVSTLSREAKIIWQMVEKTVKRLKEVDSPEQAENVGVENVRSISLEDGGSPSVEIQKGLLGGGTSVIEKLCWGGCRGFLTEPGSLNLRDQAYRKSRKANVEGG